MSDPDHEPQVPPEDGWQELPTVEVRALGPLFGSSIGLPIYAEYGFLTDAVSAPFQLRVGGTVYSLDLKVSIPAFKHLTPDAKLETIVAAMIADECRLVLLLEKTDVRNK